MALPAQRNPMVELFRLSTNQDEDEKRHRVLLDQVFDEAHDVFKDNFTIKKCPPKQRSSNQSKLELTEPEHVSHRCSSGVERKAGKTFFRYLLVMKSTSQVI
jgi:hypothetical protein